MAYRRYTDADADVGPRRGRCNTVDARRHAAASGATGDDACVRLRPDRADRRARSSGATTGMVGRLTALGLAEVDAVRRLISHSAFADGGTAGALFDGGRVAPSTRNYPDATRVIDRTWPAHDRPERLRVAVRADLFQPGRPAAVARWSFATWGRRMTRGGPRARRWSRSAAIAHASARPARIRRHGRISHRVARRAHRAERLIENAARGDRYDPLRRVPVPRSSAGRAARARSTTRARADRPPRPGSRRRTTVLFAPRRRSAAMCLFALNIADRMR
jgi:hypothetical protein